MTEKLEIVILLVRHYGKMSAVSDEHVRWGLMSLLQALYYDIGLMRDSMLWYEKIITIPTYAEVCDYRRMWKEQRNSLSIDESTGNRKVHIFTIASDPCEELDNLLFTAQLAGVTINVRKKR